MTGSTIIAAIITGVASITAALTTALVLRKKKPDETKATISNNRITAGRDNFIAGGNLHVQQAQEHFISAEGARMLYAVSKEIIPDQTLRIKWNDFDTRFLSECVKETIRGVTFDSVAAEPFYVPENDQMFSLSAKIYIACYKKINNEANPDYCAFNRLAQIYTHARLTIRGQESPF